MEPLRWICPFCDYAAIIKEDSYSSGTFDFYKSNIHGKQKLNITFIACPNPDCKEYTLTVSLFSSVEPLPPEASPLALLTPQVFKKQWRLIPPSEAKIFPSSIVPQGILDDYQEACLIRDLSPKASATLSRRCLQGMVRDFWEVEEPNLKLEIEAIEDKVETDTWKAIDAVRTVGNIGAHMEKDIDLIIDVEPNEARLLIELIETLIKDWYIARHQHDERLKAIKEIAEGKIAKKKGSSEPNPST